MIKFIRLSLTDTTPQSLPHEYPPQPAFQLCSADTQDQIENP